MKNGPICRYLKQYFVDKAALATLAGLSIDVIDQLVSGGAVPREVGDELGGVGQA